MSEHRSGAEERSPATNSSRAPVTDAHGAQGSELSSMAATVDGLVARVAAMAEASARSDGDRVAKGPRGALSISQELYETERSLSEAARRLSTVAAALRSSA